MPIVRRKIFKRFYRLYALYIILLCFLCAVIFGIVNSNFRTKILIEEESKLMDLDMLVEEIMEQIRADVRFLSSQTELYIANDNHEYKRHIRESYLQYSVSKRIFDQVRYIDVHGKEKVRVDCERDQFKLIDDSLLQDKSDRYYFKEIQKLEKGEIYFSPLDLNVENGSIEIPMKPVIRTGAPLFLNDSTKFGYVVLNYLGGNILQKLQEFDDKDNVHLLLLNDDGYYLKGFSHNDEWGFMYPKRKERNFKIEYLQESENIYSRHSGGFFSNNGLFCFKTISMISKLGVMQSRYVAGGENRNNWKLISVFTESEIRGFIFDEYEKWIWFIIASLLPMGIVLYHLAKNYELNRLSSERITQKNRSLEQKNNQITSNLDELKMLNSELDYSNRKLSELNVTKDKFFSIIAHDLKNPFSAILGLIKMLNKDFDRFDKAKKIELLQMLQKSGDNVYNLLENLLSWANIQKGTMRFEPNFFSISDLVESIFVIHLESANLKRVNLNNLVRGVHVVYADKNMLTIVLNNLISNAIKFTHEGGEVKILAEEVNEELQIRIEDNGVGISKDKVGELFRIEHSFSSVGTNKEKGTGLGLLLCKEFVLKNGGEISVESVKDEGSTFMFTIPIKER